MDGILAAAHADGRMQALKGDAKDGTICVCVMRVSRLSEEVISSVQKKDRWTEMRENMQINMIRVKD